jgi:hypothetical protein
MATLRRKESLWWFECQRTSFLQRSQSREAGVEASATGRWRQEEIVLRQDDGDEEETDFREDGKRS